MKQTLRGKLTYANVISTLCLFLLIGGGTAFAASKLARNSVGSAQIKKNAVTATKVKNHSLTGSDIKVNSLNGASINLNTVGTVPSAVTANFVNGQALTKIYKTIPYGQSGVAVATISGFTLTGSCESNRADVTLTSPSTSPAAMTAVGGGAPNGLLFNYAAATNGHAGVLRLNAGEGIRGGQIENGFGESTFSATTSTGNLISGQLGYDEKTFGDEAPERCVVFGEVSSG